jgi:hypothetical protein
LVHCVWWVLSLPVLHDEYIVLGGTKHHHVQQNVQGLGLRFHEPTLGWWGGRGVEIMIMAANTEALSASRPAAGNKLHILIIFQTQYVKNGGKCGICGDSYSGTRTSEAGGKYAKGVIVRHYKKGQVGSFCRRCSAFNSSAGR